MTSQRGKKKVFVGLSGGVDSAVSAALLKEQGYEVVGVYMKNWSGDDFGIQADCPWEIDQADAEAVCMHLKIEFRSFNFEKQYREAVVSYFFDEYSKGRTPNPDVMCNKEIKFKLFLEKALEEGADFIATGHYARKIEDFSGNNKMQIPNSKKAQSSKLRNQNSKLLTGIDDNKNQVYFLYNITQEQLSKTLFPVGHLTKPEVRELAKKLGLPNAEKPDSQGICFIGKINVLQFLMKNIPEKKGEIRDIDTNLVVGEHNGIYFYTIGQREGLKIGGQSIPYYVCSKDSQKNILYVCHGDNHPALFKKEVELENLHLISFEITGQADKLKLTQMSNLSAMIRYRQKPQRGQLRINNEQLTIGNLNDANKLTTFIFDEPQRAVASGQSLVIFNGEECLGGGIIK